MTEFEPRGVYPALPTPIAEDGSINYEASENHIEYLAENGVDGVVPAGCTGHAATLGDQGEDLYGEHVEYVSRVAEMAREHGLDVIAGDGLNSTQQTIDLATEVEEAADIDAHLMISPYQNCPPQDLIVSHYEDIAEEVDAPIVAYNVPGRTGRNIEADTVMDLAETPGVTAIKEASNDPQQIAEIGERLDEEGHEDFYLLSGDDPRNDLVYRVGGSGTISVSGNVAPAETVEVWEEGVENENYDVAEELNQELMPLHDAMFQEGEKNPISVQYALNELGFEFGTPRAPLDREPLEGEEVHGTEYHNQSEIDEVLEDLGLVEAT